MASLFRTLFGCCLCGSETDNEPERQSLLESPIDNTQAPPEVISGRGTVSDDKRNTALKQRLNNIVSNASHGMRSAPSPYGTYYGATSLGQTPSSSNPPPPQLLAGAAGGTGGAQVSRAGSRRSLASNRLRTQAQSQAGTGTGGETSSAEAAPKATLPHGVVSPLVSNLTPQVRTSLPGPGSGVGGSGTSSSPSPDHTARLHNRHLDEEPERGRRMNGTKDVLDAPGRRSSVASLAAASKPVSKDPYGRRESMDIPSPNGKSPLHTQNHGGVGSFKLPYDDELILQYD